MNGTAQEIHCNAHCACALSVTAGTGHSAELSLLFGYPQLEDDPEALAHSQFPASSLAAFQFTQRDKDYGDFLSTLWTNFAKFWSAFGLCVVQIRVNQIHIISMSF